MVIFLIMAVAFSITFPYLSNLYHFESASVEISGLRPKEKIVIERSTMTFYTKEGFANEQGVAIFNNVSLGDWKVVEGGTAELQKMVIPVREGSGKECGRVRHFWKISWQAVGGCRFEQGPVKVYFQ